MARSSKPRSATSWVESLDAQEVAAAYDEATTDAYGEEEQHTGLLTAIGDELQFPFAAKVMGQDVQVVDLEWPESDAYGLDLIVETAGAERHRIAAQSVELRQPLPEGAEFLAPYLDWRRRF